MVQRIHYFIKFNQLMLLAQVLLIMNFSFHIKLNLFSKYSNHTLQALHPTYQIIKFLMMMDYLKMINKVQVIQLFLLIVSMNHNKLFQKFIYLILVLHLIQMVFSFFVMHQQNLKHQYQQVYFLNYYILLILQDNNLNL